MTARRLNILFTTWDGGGNVPPVIEAARRLMDRGHRVHILADETIRTTATAAGAAFTPWREGPQRGDMRVDSALAQGRTANGPMGEIIALRDAIIAGGALGHARDTAAELDRAPYDLVVTSEMVPGALIAAQARGVKSAILSANLPPVRIPGIPPMGPGLTPALSEAERILHAEIAEAGRQMFNGGLPALNAARAAFGLAPLAEFAGQLAVADRILAATSPAFDFPAAELPETLVYIGPMAGTPVAAEGWTSPFAPQDLRPLVVVAFSTTYMAQEAQIANAIAALGRLPVRALVTLGPALAAAAFDAPVNVKVVAEAPHDVVMAEAGLVLTHAGHGTVIRALGHGTPLICMPMGRDQNDNAARIDWHGAGLRLDPAADADAIEAAIRKIFGDPSYRKAARRLQTAIAADIAASPFIAEIEALGAAGRRSVDFAPAA